MRPFNHKNVISAVDAEIALKSGENAIIAGGTDLLGTLKDEILPDYPKTLVNIKTIPGLDYITETDTELRIGALTRLSDIASNPAVIAHCTAVSQAAQSVGSPHLREMGTIGGNIAQLNRCWYFRKLNNRFDCIRKGGSECFAITGENKFHSIFGGVRPGAAPCSQGCPAGTDIPSYMEKVRCGDLDAAASIIMRSNPIPAITSRVCAHFCQMRCNRQGEDSCVQSGAVERVVGDYILDNFERFYICSTSKVAANTAIVGAGAAGLSAAFYLAQSGVKVTVYDSKDEPGGMLMYAIPKYRLPVEIVRRTIKALEFMGVEFKTGVRVGTDVTPASLEADYDAVLYCTGAWRRPIIGLAGEELTTFGLDFLTEVDRWFDGKIGTDVIVTGGGNVAMDVAITAKRLGARNVTLVCLEPRDKMPASPDEIRRAEDEGIAILPSWGLKRVLSDNGAVKGLELVRCVSVTDETGAFNPRCDDNDVAILKGVNILMAVGQMTDLSFFDESYKLKLSNRGLIESDVLTGGASRPGIFAAGDAATGPMTVINAIAGGKRAADGMLAYLKVESRKKAQSPVRAAFDPDGILNSVPLTKKERPRQERNLTREDSDTPSVSEAEAEAKRCLACACYSVTPSDLAPVLVALRAKIVTGKRTISAEEFFTVAVPGGTVLECGEIITEIIIPHPEPGVRTAFEKFRYRKSIDFPVVNCAVSVGAGESRIVLGAVAPTPHRAARAEREIAGKALTAELIDRASKLAADGAAPPKSAAYKTQLVCATVKKALSQCAEPSN